MIVSHHPGVKSLRLFTVPLFLKQKRNVIFVFMVGFLSADDAMAIFLALRSPEVEVIGLTTIYGNVYTTLATRNALHLVCATLCLH